MDAYLFCKNIFKQVHFIFVDYLGSFTLADPHVKQERVEQHSYDWSS